MEENPVPFNPWSLYGVAWLFSSVRQLRAQLLDREAEIAWHIQAKYDALAELRADRDDEIKRANDAHAGAFAELKVEKDAEAARLRDENRELLNRLLKRQSTEPLASAEAKTEPVHIDPSVRRQFKPPIASHNAEARAKEELAMRERREAEKREAIRKDAA